MADSLKLTPAPPSTAVQATLEVAYQEQVERVRQDNASLGRDFVALITFFLIIVTYHIQSPLLQFEVDFGRAFRSVTLQPVLAVALLICTLILVSSGRRLSEAWATLRREPIRLVGAILLLTYTIHVVLAIVFKVNLLGTILGIPQELFTDSVEDDGPIQAFQTALSISTVFAGVGIIGTVMLWSPWSRLNVYARAIRKNAPVLIVALAVLIIWEVLLVALGIQEFLLPRPSVIGTTFLSVYSKGLISVAWNTFQNAFWGFVVGCGLGILTGIISARFTSFSKALLPLAIAANSVPVIAFAPIMNNWFGALNPASKIAIVAILTYFPAMISTVKGLTSVDTLSLELMQSYAASPTTIFRKLRFPNALPYIFSSLKVSTTLAMIGAIVSEYFGGSTQGLGYRIREDAALFRYAESWSSIVIASVLGILFYLLVSAVERAVMPWHVSFREE